MTYYVHSVRTKKIYNESHSKVVALNVLERYNKTRGELGFAMMDKETYERNYGKVVLREK